MTASKDALMVLDHTQLYKKCHSPLIWTVHVTKRCLDGLSRYTAEQKDVT